MKVFEGVLVTGQKVFLRLGQGELDIHPAAVAEHHDKEGKPPPGAAHRQKSGRTPIHLGALTRRKMQFQKGGLTRWAHGAHVFLEDAVAAGVAILPQPLQQLLGGEGMRGQQPHDRALVRIEFAGPLGLLARLIRLAFDPFAHGSFIQLQRRRNLRHGHLFLIAQLPDLMEGLVINHAAPPWQARRRMSPTLNIWPAREPAGGAVVWGAGNAST